MSGLVFAAPVEQGSTFSIRKKPACPVVNLLHVSCRPCKEGRDSGGCFASSVQLDLVWQTPFCLAMLEGQGPCVPFPTSA